VEVAVATGGWDVIGAPVDSVGAPAAGPPVGTERSPGRLRELALATRLAARDHGDLDVRIVGPDRDLVSGIVGWPSVAATTTAVRAAVGDVVAGGRRPLLVGGCCALVMGAVAGARDRLGRVGLVCADGHVDLYDHRSSPTGEAADMPVAALLGLGWPQLLATMGQAPVLAGSDVVVLGARDPVEAADIADLPARLGVRVHSAADIVAGPGALGARTAQRFEDEAAPFWLHLDVDVLDQTVFGATDYLMPGGIDLVQLADLLRPLGRSDALIGMSVGCYNPDKDPDGRCGENLADLLVAVLADGPALDHR
jgi:arginase